MARREKEPEDGQTQDRRPTQDPVFGGEKDQTPVGRAPVPGNCRVGTEAKKSTEDDGASDESGQEREYDGNREGYICGEEWAGGAKVFLFPGIPVRENGFDQREKKKDAIRKINIDHQAGQQAEKNPLKKGSAIARAIPIPEKHCHDKDRVRMGPRRIEIHINRKRTGAPDGESGKKGPALLDVLSGEGVRKKQAEETVNASTQGHGQDIGSGETISRNVRAKNVSAQHEGVRRKQKGSPKYGRTDGEDVTDVSGFRVLTWIELHVRAGSRLREVKIRMPPIFFESQIVLYERRASISVVSDAVPMHDRVYKRQRQQKQNEEDSSRPDRAAPASGQISGLVRYRLAHFLTRTLRQASTNRVPKPRM